MKHFLIAIFLLIQTSMYAQKQFTVNSPDGSLSVLVSCEDSLSFSVIKNNKVIIEPSSIGMLIGGENVKSLVLWGDHPVVRNSKIRTISNEVVNSPFYKKDQIIASYNELRLTFKNNYSLLFRAYDDGIAYRFVNTAKKPELIVNEELADYNFPVGTTAYAAYANHEKEIRLDEQYFNSFENIYDYQPLAQLNYKRLIILPILLSLPDSNLKICITESDLYDYPGMFVMNDPNEFSLKGIWAPVPSKTVQGGHNNLQQLVESRHHYIAKTTTRIFPWRIFAIADNDEQLLDNDLVYLLASPNKIVDTSWIKPGKVAWDWWNDWNISGVDFKSGVNTETYKHYIDFASEHGVEYVILDEGWAVNKQADLFQVVPEIDLEEIISYANQKNVDIILWAGYWAYHKDMEKVTKHYADMGVKGFKIDFMDRDDQQIIDFMWKAAQVCADNKMLIDYHGVCKPFGIQRTYPNVINFEGVHGLEQMKWRKPSCDQVTYDLQFPFIRMLAGPVDYTQGAMRNATKANYKPVYNEPMSQGTRSRQLAQYVIFDSPLNMLCDAPTAYMAEPECTEYIATIPTVWDETVALPSKISEYINIARRSDNTWYVGGMNDWTTRDQIVDLSFLPEGDYIVTLYRDGINADKKASDYKKETFELKASAPKQLAVKMYPGGGYAAVITKKLVDL